jgi:hypothetical protein
MENLQRPTIEEFIKKEVLVSKIIIAIPFFGRGMVTAREKSALYKTSLSAAYPFNEVSNI